MDLTTIRAFQERHKDVLRAAERDRLVRQARAGQEEQNSFYCRALTSTGRRLVAWGLRLQERLMLRLRPLCLSLPVMW